MSFTIYKVASVEDAIWNVNLVPEAMAFAIAPLARVKMRAILRDPFSKTMAQTFF